MSCLLAGWDCYQIELFFLNASTNMRLNNTKVTRKEVQATVSL